MLTSAGLPGTCEADVYGNLTALLLQKTSGDVSFVADLVHLDRETNTAVFWHCGLAPVQMRRPSERPTAAIHSNRRMPLLYEFALRPGRVTIARISRSGGVLSLALGGAEMTNEPLPFSGTAGVAVMDSGVTDLIDTIMGHGLEHHYGIVYGDHIDELERFAADAGLGAIRL
jgi:L-fucose isomerase-like protein